MSMGLPPLGTIELPLPSQALLRLAEQSSVLALRGLFDEAPQRFGTLIQHLPLFIIQWDIQGPHDPLAAQHDW